MYLLTSSIQTSWLKLFYNSYDSFWVQISFFSTNQKWSLYHSLVSKYIFQFKKGDKVHNTLLKISYNHTIKDQFCIKNQETSLHIVQLFHYFCEKRGFSTYSNDFFTEA